MLFKLILMLTLVPMLELVILLQVHHAVASAWGTGVGLAVTIGTIGVTGILGATLARQQGVQIIRELKTQIGGGHPPARAVVDGVMVLVGAALLLTPGFLTDLLGFSLLVPMTRAVYRKAFREWIRNKLQRGDVNVFFVGSKPVDKSTM